MIGIAERRQLNVYVPTEGEATLERLRDLSRRTGRPLNRLVMEAISEYVRRRTSQQPSFRTFDLGVKEPVRRTDVYEERLDRKVSG